MVAGIEYIRTQVKDGVYYRHLNLGGATRQGKDGRNLYYTPQGYNGACWNTNGTPLPVNDAPQGALQVAANVRTGRPVKTA